MRSSVLSRHQAAWSFKCGRQCTSSRIFVANLGENGELGIDLPVGHVEGPNLNK
jgi:hypothetical protein